MKQHITFLFFLVQIIVSAILFSAGMFPIKKFSGIVSSEDDIPNKIGNSTRMDPQMFYKKHADKLVIMVVDAMRYDFIVNNNNTMPHLSTLLESDDNCFLKVKVEVPTVTMPRIKALMSGSIPGYSDVFMNFMEQSALMDNILLQASEKGLISVFYGDKTWIDLYPHAFNRSEGTTSFIVTDYEEVDFNVTRNVKEELQRTDWDIMILHYLGLDHIGHMEGPSSSLVKPKLQEMDNVIYLINDYIVKRKLESEKVVFLLCSDHGMKDTGGHGGSSLPEVIVPYIFLNYKCDPEVRNLEINQIDITPLLSVLLGIPIPSESIGKLHYKLLNEMDLNTALYLIHYNTKHIKEIFTRYEKSSGLLDLYDSAEKMYENVVKTNNVSSYYNVVESYFAVQEAMSSYLIKKSVEFDKHTMWVSLILLFQITFNIVVNSSLTYSGKNLYWCIASYGLLVMFTSKLHLVTREGPSWFYKHDVLYILILSNRCFLSPQIGMLFGSSLPQRTSRVNLSLPFVLGIYMVLLGSSSFIEEEHMFWYFAFTTYLFLKALDGSIFSLFLLILHNIFQNVNSTGVKYANLPDIADWLNYEANSSRLFSFYILGLFVTLCWYYFKIVEKGEFSVLLKIITTITMGIQLGCVLLVKTGYGAIKVYFLNGVSRIIGFHFIWISCCIHWTLFCIFSYSKSTSGLYRYGRRRVFMIHFMDGLVPLTIVLLCFTLKPHNIFVVPFILIVSSMLIKVCMGDALQFTILHIATGMLCFFYQGNSNNLATIDVSCGFFSLHNPSLILSGVLIYINTHASQILSTLLLLHGMYTDHRLMYQQSKIFKCMCLFCSVYVLSYSVIITFQQNHLFIWSVFSPKLLYVVSSVTIYCFLFIVIILVELCFSVIEYCYDQLELMSRLVV